jgi:hypothetical protein
VPARGAAVAVAAALLLAACGGRGAQTYTTGQPSWAQGSIGPRPAAAYAAEAEEVAHRSRLVRQLVGPGGSLREAFVWLGTSRRPQVVELAYRLARPGTVDAVVPFAVNPPDAPATGDCRSPYAPGWERLRARPVGVVFVGVDVSERRVADIETDAPWQVVSSVPGRPFPHCDEVH